MRTMQYIVLFVALGSFSAMFGIPRFFVILNRVKNETNGKLEIKSGAPGGPQHVIMTLAPGEKKSAKVPIPLHRVNVLGTSFGYIAGSSQHITVENANHELIYELIFLVFMNPPYGANNIRFEAFMRSVFKPGISLWNYVSYNDNDKWGLFYPTFNKYILQEEGIEGLANEKSVEFVIDATLVDPNAVVSPFSSFPLLEFVGAGSGKIK